jgi:MFS-type transporter involved in bile tolerance (Atg22 family)
MYSNNFNVGSWYDKDDTRMNVIYVCALFAYFLLCLCSICENRIQILIQKCICLIWKIINRGGQVIKAASINTLMEAGYFKHWPRLIR